MTKIALIVLFAVALLTACVKPGPRFPKTLVCNGHEIMAGYEIYFNTSGNVFTLTDREGKYTQTYQPYPGHPCRILTYQPDGDSLP